MSEKSLYDYDRGRTGIPRPEGGEWKDGFCTICSVDKATHNCVKCGGIVCAEHFVSLMGLCVGCAPVKETGKAFKMSEPLTGRSAASSPPETTVQQIATAVTSGKHTTAKPVPSSGSGNVFTFGVEEPKDVRQVVLPPKRTPGKGRSSNHTKGVAKTGTKTETKAEKDVILFERKKPRPVKTGGRNPDDDTINIEWV